MHKTTIFGIRIDFEKSQASYIFDKNTNQFYLDFFGLYSSLPLGYNHEIFDTEEFRREYNRVAAFKVPNCEIISDEAQDFLTEFTRYPSMQPFKLFHFCCTGALAIEAAMKVAIDQKRSFKPMILSLKESFHGINSYGGFLTDRFWPVSERLNGLPDLGWEKLHNPKVIYKDNEIDERETKKGMDKFLEEFEGCLRRYGQDNIAALLIEPIQSTYGDNYFPREFFIKIRALCDRHDICLVFDEIQTGFGATGKMWYFEHVGVIPDIVVFGKKAQTSGIMAREKFGKIFEKPSRLEVTWDGDLTDFIRAKYVLRAYQKNQIFHNVAQRSQQLADGLRLIKELKNVRATGMLLAFDIDTRGSRDAYFNRLKDKRLLTNKTTEKTIRLRPNLNVSKEEVEKALTIMQSSCLVKSHA